MNGVRPADYPQWSRSYGEIKLRDLVEGNIGASRGQLISIQDALDGLGLG